MKEKKMNEHKWINTGYLKQLADDYEDEGRTATAEDIRLTAEWVKSLLRRVKTLDALRDACHTNTNVDWALAELSPNEEFKGLVAMIDEGVKND
jgi:hypothetical protein